MNFIDIVVGAPWWVWGILVFLIHVGLKSIDQHSVYIPKLFLIPTVLMILKYKDIFSTHYSIAITFIFLFIGSIIGACFAKKSIVKFNKQDFSVVISGSYLTFVILIIFFCIKFGFGYLQSTNPELRQNYIVLDRVVSSLFSGYFLGRACFFLLKFYKAKC